MNRRIQYVEGYLKGLLEKHKGDPIRFEYTLASELLGAAREFGYGVDLEISVLSDLSGEDKFQVIK